MSDLRLKAEEAVEKLSKAVASTGEDLEFRQQLHQLNIPLEEKASPSRRTQATSGKGRKKSNLCAPYPPNMPLALLKLMESYVVGFAEVPKEKGGWAEAKRERGLNLVKSLCGHLGDAERLSSSMFIYPYLDHMADGKHHHLYRLLYTSQTYYGSTSLLFLLRSCASLVDGQLCSCRSLRDGVSWV